MAEIYLAQERGLEGLVRTVVIKRILPTYSDNPEFVTMFLDEARLMASLSHPHIAAVYSVGHDEESYYITMEHVRGPTL
ncbi:MAG: protein kinase, partial [Gammaproteobacteria bacterium]|nr:protein kinase [Gemmatimonadota bacterium]NIU78358.1 protein kinase [Gammaproteobacteria bacterium]